MAERVGQRVQHLRDQAGWTQEALARRAGITRGYLARIETGRHEPTLTTLELLASALGIPVRAILPTGGGPGAAWRALAETEETVREHLRALPPGQRAGYAAEVADRLLMVRRALHRTRAELGRRLD